MKFDYDVIVVGAGHAGCEAAAAAANLTQEILIEINIGGEESKSGVSAESLWPLLDMAAAQPHIRLRGLMAIPEHTRDEGVLAAQMRRMQALFTELAQQYPSVDTLSMGMTEDLEAAVAHGSTMVRVGTAIFGARDYS